MTIQHLEIDTTMSKREVMVKYAIPSTTAFNSLKRGYITKRFRDIDISEKDFDYSDAKRAVRHVFFKDFNGHRDLRLINHFDDLQQEAILRCFELSGKKPHSNRFGLYCKISKYAIYNYLNKNHVTKNNIMDSFDELFIDKGRDVADISGIVTESESTPVARTRRRLEHPDLEDAEILSNRKCLTCGKQLIFRNRDDKRRKKFCNLSCSHMWAHRNSRNTPKFTIDGKSKIMEDWCKEYGIKYSAVTSRIRRGWDVEKALTTPIDKKHWAKTKPRAGQRDTWPEPDDGFSVYQDTNRHPWEHWARERDRYCARMWPGLFKEVTDELSRKRRCARRPAC